MSAVLRRRLLTLALTVIAAPLLAAVMVRYAPGFGVDESQFDTRLSNESVEAIAAGRARDASLPRYFWNYFSGIVRGDFGTSVSLNRPVRQLIAERAGITLATLAAGIGLAWSSGLAAALLLELLRRKHCDLLAAIISGALLCLPSAMLALLCLYLGAGAAWALAAVLAPRIFRYARNALSAAGAQSQVLAARARGIGRVARLMRHICLPAAPELLALAGVSVNMALGAVIAVEALCDSPGLGQLVWHAALARDLPVLVNLTVLIAGTTAVANLLADFGQTLLQREAA